MRRTTYVLGISTMVVALTVPPHALAVATGSSLLFIYAAVAVVAFRVAARAAPRSRLVRVREALIPAVLLAILGWILMAGLRKLHGSDIVAVVLLAGGYLGYLIWHWAHPDRPTRYPHRRPESR